MLRLCTTLSAATAAILLTGCVALSPPDADPPRHHPAGRSLPLVPPASPSPLEQPPGIEELVRIGPSPAASATADHQRHRKPAARPERRPQPPVAAPHRARPSSPRSRPRPPASAPPRRTERWAPSTPRVPSGGGMRSVCRSAQGVTSPGVVTLCRSIAGR
ncbi:hypothetical protein [Streptomyces fulvorobeus]|uniref:Lipoprotein n=1 Tax=Streptomyces fulvorobeus TaxID=284028 RepID=A0A7J0CI05_9ACTN|nr:hypothetical protein [Streptomyces fulvorobeus]NYE44858.1 hypothetical protein [Streptomyces fulvorobeus]GFN01425.1 hypothetical protein Sfulv_62350 [Streptomyces fulvorobeus]